MRRPLPLLCAVSAVCVTGVASCRPDAGRGVAGLEGRASAAESGRARVEEPGVFGSLVRWLGAHRPGRGPTLRVSTEEDQALEEPTYPDDTGGADAIPTEVDVVVVGSGPAGMAAALAARELGASVLVLDRASTAGEGIVYGGRFFAVGTAYQEALGVSDSPTIAAEEWDDITGVDGDTPAVTTFLEASADALAWMEGYGLVVDGVTTDLDAGDLERVHQLDGKGSRLAILEAYDGELSVGVEVDELLVEDGVVTGVSWTELASGETGRTAAGAVVVATGGFLRDRELVTSSRPELSTRTLVAETNPQSDGGGVAFLEAVGADFTHMDGVGVYVHAIRDPYEEEGEALVFSSPDEHLIVGTSGERFADESLARSLDLFDELPDGEIFLVTTDARAASLRVARPAYNWEDVETPEAYELVALASDSPDVFDADSLSNLALATGIDELGLLDTVSEVNAMILAGETDAFGRDFTLTDLFESDVWWAARLAPGLAKAFGGVRTDTEARVLDEDGAVIVGLYAAGEVAGMIPDGGGGAGFTGSAGACYTFGRIAGTNAATLALEAE